MAIRMSIKADLTPFDGLEALLGNAERATSQIMQGVVNKHGTKLLRPIRRFGPGKSRHGAKRGAWSTNFAADARARRWWFANHGNRPYRRTGKTGKAWVFVVRNNRMSLENASPAAKYVFSFAAKPRARGGRPNPGHIRTGWPSKGRLKATAVLDTAKDLVEDSFARSIVASVAKGRFTIVVP